MTLRECHAKSIPWISRKILCFSLHKAQVRSTITSFPCSGLITRFSTYATRLVLPVELV